MLYTPAKMKQTPTCNEVSLSQTKFMLLLAVKRCCVQDGEWARNAWLQLLSATLCSACRIMRAAKLVCEMMKFAFKVTMSTQMSVFTKDKWP